MFEEPRKHAVDQMCWSCGGNMVQHKTSCKHHRPSLITEIFSKQQNNLLQRFADIGITEANAQEEAQRAINLLVDLQMAFPKAISLDMTLLMHLRNYA